MVAYVNRGRMWSKFPDIFLVEKTSTRKLLDRGSNPGLLRERQTFRASMMLPLDHSGGLLLSNWITLNGMFMK